MPPFVAGLAIGAGAYYADGFLKDAFHSHSDMIDITWVDLAVAGAALYFSPKGSAVGVVGGWVAAMWIRGQLAGAALPPATTSTPPASTSTPPASTIKTTSPTAPPAVTNPGPGFTNVVFSSSPRDAGPLVFTSGGGPGQM